MPVTTTDPIETAREVTWQVCYLVSNGEHSGMQPDRTEEAARRYLAKAREDERRSQVARPPHRVRHDQRTTRLVSGMRCYLIVYDRDDGEIVLLRRFSDSREALSHRFAHERHAAPSEEVVVLCAGSLAALRVSHGRYFLTAAELAERALATGTTSR
jgi:plasmid stabilization system protein ParE